MVRRIKILRQRQWFLGALVLLALLMPRKPAWADMINWNAAVGDWNTAANWNPQQVPTAYDDAIVNNGGTAQIISNHAEAFFMRVGDNATGTVEQNAFSLTLYFGFWVGAAGPASTT